MATQASRLPGKETAAKIKEDQTKNRLKEMEADKEFDQEQLSLDESPVLTAAGVPDMRFKENRQSFLFDRAKTIKGTPDNRLKQNRPDIQMVHARRGDDKPNVRFAGPGKMKNEQEDGE